MTAVAVACVAAHDTTAIAQAPSPAQAPAHAAPPRQRLIRAARLIDGLSDRVLTADIRALERVRWLMKGGVIYAPERRD